MKPMKPIDSVLNTMPTAANAAKKTAKPQAANGGKTQMVDAINQVFAEMEIAYHNQFHKAYAQEGSLNVAKKYWLNNLADYPPEVLKLAIRHLVKTSEFMPTIAAMLAACENGQALFGLPPAEAAYREACLAPEPKRSHTWSHPAVYWAAEAAGWFVLANETQAVALPQFNYYYAQMCRRVLQGEQLDVPLLPALPAEVFAPLTSTQSKKKLLALRKQLEL
jgi:hypothetical protein